MRSARTSTFALTLAAALATTSFGAPARAADPKASADALIASGVELRRQQRDADALAVFQRAFEIEPSARARAQMGLAEQSLFRWVDAEGHLADALADEKSPWIAQHRATVELGLVVVRRHLGWLTLRTSAPRAHARIGERPPIALPADGPLRVPAGEVTVDIDAPGFLAARVTVQIPPEQTVVHEVTLTPIAPTAAATSSASAPPIAPASTPRTARTRGGSGAGDSETRPRAPDASLAPGAPMPAMRIAGLAVGGAGLVGLGVAGVFGGLALDRKAVRDGACDATGCGPDGIAADGDGRAWGDRATVAAVAGLVFVGAGVVLFAIGRAPSATSAMRANGVVVRF